MLWNPSYSGTQTYSGNIGYNGAYETMLHSMPFLAAQIAFSRCCQATTAHLKRFLVHKLNLVGNTVRIGIFTTWTGGITSKMTLVIISKERMHRFLFFKNDSYLGREICNQNDSHHINYICMCLYQGTKWEISGRIFKII